MSEEQLQQAEKLLGESGSVTVAGAVKEYGVGRTRLYELMGSGQLPYSDTTGRRLIPRAAIVRLLARGMKGMAETIATVQK